MCTYGGVIFRNSPLTEKPHSFLDDINSLGMILRSARGAIGETEVTCDEQNVAIITLFNEYGAC